jgi:hypothetical protein
VGVLDVWQVKDLREGVFGSVARIGVSCRFRGCVAKKGLTENGKWKSESGNWAREEAGTVEEESGQNGPGEGGKKIAGTLKREILRLAAFAQDDYPRRIVIGGAHGLRDSITETSIYDNYHLVKYYYKTFRMRELRIRSNGSGVSDRK